MALPQHFWSRFGMVCTAIIGVVSMLFLLPIAFGLFWRIFLNERVIVVNDTANTHQVARIWQDNDANKLRKADAQSLAPGKKLIWDSDGFAVLRCAEVVGQGNLYLNAPWLKDDERYANIIMSHTWKNIFGHEVTDYTISLSSILANTQTLPCPWMEDIVK